MRILVPKFSFGYNDYVPGSPVFFLAGPVRGGGEWQHDMTLILAKMVPNCTIAIPCRWDESHPLSPFFIRSTRAKYPRQLNWERAYLKTAGIGFNPGCVIFWLALESQEEPHPGPEPYSMDTRGEIAEWRMRMKFQNARVVVGAHPDYHGLSQIERNYTQELGYKFPIYSSMFDTAQAAVRMMHKKAEPIPGGNY